HSSTSWGGSGEHVPSLPERSQERQEPPHSTSQHTEPSQNPLPHSSGCVQNSPKSSRHTPSLQPALHPLSQHTPAEVQLPLWHISSPVQGRSLLRSTWQFSPSQ